MEINDKRIEDGFTTVLTDQGLCCSHAIRGVVVERQGSRGLYILCRESMHDPMTSGAGQMRSFLVDARTGERVLHRPQEVIRCRVVEDAVLNVGE